MILKVFTDGGARGNPGPAAVGIVAYNDGREVFQHHEYIGKATNNVAEYTAVLKAMLLLKQYLQEKVGIERINFFSDSELLVNQLNGIYKVKNANIRELIVKIRTLESEVKVPVFFTAIPRVQNRVADKLVNIALDTHF